MTQPPTQQPTNGPLPEGVWASPLCAAWCRPGDIPENKLRKVDLGDMTAWDAVCWHASELLYAASGRQWRGQPGKVREASFFVSPQSGELSCRPGAPRGYDGSWAHPLDSWGGTGFLRSRMESPRRIRLPDDDATELLEVQIDGQDQLAGTDLMGAGWLYRQRGWPVDGTLSSITYRFGKPPGRAGVSCASDLAVELARWKVGDDRCQLPNRITTVTREAVTWTFADPTELVKSGFTGISHIDSWLRAVNPYMRPAEAQIISPDLHDAR